MKSTRVLVSGRTDALSASGDARAILDAAMSEKDFMQTVIDCAHRNHWAVYHTYDSRRSASGYPDLTLAHEGRGVIFVEVKKEGGRLSANQCAWRDLLLASGQRWFLWKPSDWPEIEATLKGEN